MAIGRAALWTIGRRIAVLERERERLRRAVPAVTAQIETLRSALSILTTGGLDRGTPSSGGSSPAVAGRPLGRAGTTLAAVAGVLRRAGKPLRVAEILDRLRTAGSRTPRGTVGKTLARGLEYGVLRRAATGVYALAVRSRRDESATGASRERRPVATSAPERNGAMAPVPRERGRAGGHSARRRAAGVRR